MRFVSNLGRLALVSSLTACRATAPSEPRSGPAPATAPNELLPDDLDFVVRIDAARVRQNPALAGLFRDLAKTRQSELLDSITAAFGDASTVWIGTRWMSDGFHGDGVVAIEGPPGSEGFGVARGTMPSTLRRVAVARRDVEAFERPAKARGEALLEVLVNGRGMVLATAAEADAVLRVMRFGPDQGRLDPPARGLVSFAGRLRGGAPFGGAVTSGMLQRLTEGLIGYAGSLEEGDAIDIDASFSYASAAEAARAAERAKETAERLVAAGGVLKNLANSVKFTELGSSLRLRAAVPFAWLSDLH